LAISCCEELLELNENSFTAYFYLSEIYPCLDNAEKAMECIEKGLAINPKSAKLWINKAWLHYNCDFESFKKAYETALRLEPNNIENYINNPGERFLGAVVGPYANRIAGGTYTIGEEVYEFPQNNNGQTLHGGLKGVDMVVWNVDEVDEDSIVLSYTHPDGLDGMPGNLNIVMTYTLTPENEFRVDYVAETDKATHVNLSHHSFFNLKGEGNGTITDNVMVINASHTTPVNEVLIPSGEIADVTGTPFDFREPHVIGERIDVENEQLRNGLGYDHNWVLDRKTPDQLEFAASVHEPVSGRFLEVYTDQPAMQFYSGNFFDGKTNGKYGKALKFRESIALETQKYPDTPHHDNFPSTLLNPGEKYTHTCVYRFSVK
jgi:aldose 1-epimerase